MKRAIYAGFLAATAILVQSSAFAQSILDDPKINQLQDQDIDANQALVEALRRAAKKGPVFRISPGEFAIETETGEEGSSSVRITNAGDEKGKIQGINLIGSIPGMSLESSCGEELQEGDFCEVTVFYKAENARDVETAVIGTINEIGRSSFEIPVSVSVKEPPTPEPVVIDKPQPVVIQPEKKPAGPMPRDIAREYFGAIRSGGRVRGTGRGFAIVSAERDPGKSTEVAGVRYQDISVESARSDERYDGEIPYTNASLPVDRDKILTTDRVIKAVLETSVSNVMCNKVVAMVESDVYSATSDRPLIQAGSRVVGECREFVDERVGIVWSRIITTDGRSISFQDRVADTNDATGLGGAVGRVYMSPFDKYVLPIFSTMIDATAGVIFATFGDDEKVVVDANGNTIKETNAKNEGLRIVTGEARNTAQEVIKDIRDVREIAVIPKGTRIDIEIMEDIYFRDDRKVIRLADMRFDLDEVQTGSAERDLPRALALVPVAVDYEGAAVTVNGRRYKVEEMDADDGQAKGGSSSRRNVPEMSGQTLREIGGAGQGDKR